MLGQKFLNKIVGFLVKMMAPKRHFEINWPLDTFQDFSIAFRYIIVKKDKMWLKLKTFDSIVCVLSTQHWCSAVVFIMSLTFLKTTVVKCNEKLSLSLVITEVMCLMLMYRIHNGEKNYKHSWLKPGCDFSCMS